MTRRIVAPIVLLVAAACAVGAVFAVHRIEARGGPLAQPFNTAYFSPNDDGVLDAATIRFTTHQPERVTVEIVDRRGELVRRILDDEPIDGPSTHTWDGRDSHGRLVPDGTYWTRITRAGDARVYAPTGPMRIDTVAPVGVLDRATRTDRELRGLAFADAGAALVLVGRTGDRIDGMRTWRPASGTTSSAPSATVPRGATAMRFSLPITGDGSALTGSVLALVDAAGNRTDLAAIDDPRIRAERS